MIPETNLDFENIHNLLSTLAPLNGSISVVKKMADKNAVDLNKLDDTISKYPELQRRFLLITNSVWNNRSILYHSIHSCC